MTPEEVKAKNRAYYLKKKAEIIAQHREYRATAAGKAMRKREKANRKAKHPEKMRAEWAAYEKSESRKKYLEQNKAQRQAKCREYHATHRDRLIVQMRENHRRNRPERLAKRNTPEARAVNQELWRQWCKANPDAYSVIRSKKWHKRRAQKLNASIGVDRKALSERIREIRTTNVMPCHWCGAPTTKQKRHIDHIIPLNKNGPHAADNLCCACPRCNCSKQDKLPHEFKPQQRVG